MTDACLLLMLVAQSGKNQWIDTIEAEWCLGASPEHPNVKLGLKIIESLHEVGLVRMVVGMNEHLQLGLYGWTCVPTMIDLFDELGTIKQLGNLNVASLKDGLVKKPEEQKGKKVDKVSDVLLICSFTAPEC